MKLIYRKVYRQLFKPLSSLKNAFDSVKVKQDIIDKVNSVNVTNYWDKI